ncbi:MAG: hypothetical protein S4CHLAM45_00990 [Chlamydiales bacterium]|nr:hypothetical protein [Chlamydiales bacterium]MCH9619420.1 hypothetical protein [Chlamydiales bacterium]MCH9622224.1 hypothetical protein [Chlamydiales bacterium]
MDGGGTPPDLQHALELEVKRFKEFYLWLKESMSETFFKEVCEEDILLLVHSLMGFRVQDYFSEIHLKNSAMSLCIDSPGADVKILKNYPMYGIKNYTSYVSRKPLPFPEMSKKLRIGIIHFTQVSEEKEDTLPETHVEELVSHLVGRDPNRDRQGCRELIHKIDASFLRKMPIERQVIAIEMFERAQVRDHCQYEVQYEENWEESKSPSMYIVLAWKNVPKHNFLYRLAVVVFQHHLLMQRVNATYINPYQIDSIFLLSFALHGGNGKAAWEETDLADFLQEVVTLKYFGSEDLIAQTFVNSGLIRGNLGNLLRTTLPFIHQVLVNVDPNLYNYDHIQEGLCRHPELTVKFLEAFEYKFHPSHHNLPEYEKIREEFVHLVERLDTGHAYHDNRRKNILLQAMNFVHHTLKTNFYRNNKSAFSFRLDPSYLDNAPFNREEIFPQLPFAVFFLKGMHYFGFHIRFKDLSRGGLRTIFSEKKERMLAERNTVFSECYNLAYTQQKKNKDIPEGGAKGVIFLKPFVQLEAESEILSWEMEGAEVGEEEISTHIETFNKEQKLEYLYQTQRSYVKNLISIVNTTSDGELKAKHIIDYWKQPEYLYLGPDENMHNPMIKWIADESCKEQYKPGGAFISGKPKLGINHKEYGVTSLGLNVYIEEVLKFFGIDAEKECFTIKISGGPDGDVAGNQIYNFYKYHPKTAKIIALTDVSGTINDPEGLDLEELVNLFHKGKPIRFYPPEKLHLNGFLLDRETRREPSPYTQQTLCWRNRGGKVDKDWISANEANALFRNNLNQTECDIFVPCGGRPRTLNGKNYKEFLNEAGKPSAKAILEGANLYLSTWARSSLEELGILIVKDSSANKGGVICSSFEILCGLTLENDEFLKHKEELVEEILETLKSFALSEAQLLLKTHKETKKPLSEISDEISKRINFFSDQLLTYLETIELSDDPSDPLIKCFLDYCPKLLREKFEKQLLEQIPSNHKKAVISSRIAANLVYKRGLDWFPTLVDMLPTALKYLG